MVLPDRSGARSWRRRSRNRSRGRGAASGDGEIELGVLGAPDVAARARRAGPLAVARTVDLALIREPVMATWARLVVHCRNADAQRTVDLTDALLVANAIDLGLPVVTPQGVSPQLDSGA
jgi:hypothetical protein